MWSRRQVLGLGSGLLAALGLGAVGVALRPGVIREPAGPLTTLSPSAFSTLVAVCEVLLPHQLALPSAVGLAVPEKVDAFLGTCEASVGEEVELALSLLENALPSLLLDADVRRAFSACSFEERIAVLDAWRTSRLMTRRTVYKALHSLLSATYFSQPVVAGATGFVAPDFTGWSAPVDEVSP